MSEPPVRVLTVNAGSSTLKLALLDSDDNVLSRRTLPTRDDGIAVPELQSQLDRLGKADAVGHRVVHGGDLFRAPQRVDDRVRADLESLVSLAPLHQARSLAALDAVTRLRPELPAVACFDTAFHATLDAPATTYAVPEAWRARWPLKRYGFHGLSHAWVARTVPHGRVVSCHLGAGASLCAIRDGASVDTTMGFTPLDGLVMATRSGAVDPGLLLWLLEAGSLTPRELSDGLWNQSGLLGLSGTPDMRVLLDRARMGEERATRALEVYLHRLRAEVAAMAAALGGVDTVVFTGGVGEHAAEVRLRTVEALAFLRPFEVHVIAAREDREIARQVRDLLSGGRR